MAPKSKKPDLSNATPEFLIDEIGERAAQRKKLEGEEKYLKEALKARVKTNRMYDKEIIGEKYYGTVTKSTQERISSEKVRAIFAENELNIAEVLNEIEITTCRTAVIGEELKSSWGE